jgi:hypothetical protein
MEEEYRDYADDNRPPGGLSKKVLIAVIVLGVLSALVLLG